MMAMGGIDEIIGVNNMIPFPDKKYQIIYADPPWKYNDKLPSGHGGAEEHYKCMTMSDIKKLPVRKISDDNCILFLWITFPMLQEGLDTIRSWGFNYKTSGFVWVKKNKSDCGFFFGLGRWTRGNTEVCLLATKGKPKRANKSTSQLIFDPLTKHSKKPAIIRDRIVELTGDLPRIELFARQKTEGWDVWGNEI
jgi:N6-adenosine-specific RNA methylase IME4